MTDKALKGGERYPVSIPLSEFRDPMIASGGLPFIG